MTILVPIRICPVTLSSALEALLTGEQEEMEKESKLIGPTSSLFAGMETHSSHSSASKRGHTWVWRRDPSFDLDCTGVYTT
jgi:hypothetical protein